VILGTRGWAGAFFGPVGVFGDFFVIGTNHAKSAVVPFPDGSHRALYCLECPESWFEDFGTAKLNRGYARVSIEREFAQVADTAHYYVFLTEYGESKGLFIAGQTRN
jgi:hypothetical protein